MKQIWFSLIIVMAFALSGCGAAGKSTEETLPYRQISQEEAAEVMDRDGTAVIVDVRTIEEYEEGHIPGAICIPNETIGAERPAQLPDLDQIILVYCRSGRRSKEAAGKLAELGYTGVLEFGGIIDWTGDIETGIPEEITEDITEGEDNMADVTLKLTIRDTEVPVVWEKNASVEALMQLAQAAPVRIEMSMYGGFEQVGSLGQSIPRNDRQTTTKAGDIVLYSGDQIVIFYGQNSWAYTRLGHIDLPAGEMEALLGQEDVEILIEAE